MMKAVLYVSTLLVVALCAESHHEMPEDVKKIFDECHTEVGLPAPREKPDGPPNMDDAKQKCFHACLMKKAGSLENNKISPEKEIEWATKKMPGGIDDKWKMNINECADIANQETEECEVAGAMVKCVFEKMGPPPHHKA